MPRNELVLAGDFSFPEVLAPLAGEVAPCTWLINAQAGPFDSRWIHASAEDEALLDRLWVDVPACRDTSATCWRPGTFPRLAEQVLLDEWTYIFALRSDERELPRRAEWLLPHLGRFTEEFFAGLDEVAELFLCHADGWWALYTHHEDWRRRFQEAFPQSGERPWQEAGQPP